MKASVIATFLNEEKTVGKFVEALLNQSRIPDEIILCDGGSRDSTVERVQSFIKKGAPIKLIVKEGNRSVGRNEAIRQARNEIIVVTDAGTWADKKWFEEITKPFEKTETKAVAGFFKASSKTEFERVSSTLMLADHDNIDIETWLPSTRSIAFRKEVWQHIGGFPEHTKYNEDTPFDLAVKEAGYEFVFAPKAIVFWRPRGDLNSFFKQYYNYSIGDGLDLIHSKHYLKKTVTYLIGIIFLLSAFFTKSLAIFLIFVLGFASYLFRRDLRVVRKEKSLYVVFLAPVLTITYDLAEIFGFWRGVLKRRRKDE